MLHVLFLLVGDLPAVWTPRVGRHVPADPDQGRVRGQRQARGVLVVRSSVQIPGAAQSEQKLLIKQRKAQECRHHGLRMTRRQIMT